MKAGVGLAFGSSMLFRLSGLLVLVAMMLPYPVPQGSWDQVAALASGTNVKLQLLPGMSRVQVQSSGGLLTRELPVSGSAPLVITGVVVSTDSSTVVVTPAGFVVERWVVEKAAISHVWTVGRRNDSVVNGALIGAGAGAASWLVLSAGDTDLAAWPTVLISASIGALIGVLADGSKASDVEVLVYRNDDRGHGNDYAATSEMMTNSCLKHLRMDDAATHAAARRRAKLREALCAEIAQILAGGGR